MAIRILLADDHPAMRAGLRAILEKAPDIEIVAEAEDGLEAQRLVAELRPDVLLLDLVMPGPRPCEIERWVRIHHHETATLVLTAHDRDGYLAEMIEAGAVGFLTKNEDGERLVEAIRRAVRGEVLITGEQLSRAGHWQEGVGKKWESLTAREREVLGLVAQGKTDREIAKALCIRLKTVGNHVGRILDKLGMACRTEAALWVVREGLLDECSG